jgi:predicted Zn-dependent peptidase
MKIFEKSANALGSLYVIYESPVKLETHDELGLSHLLEHMMCCSLDDTEELFDQHGLQYNAYTGTQEVVFYLQGLTEELNKFKNLFVERICSYIPQEAHFTKELPIVLQEYADHYSDPSGSMYNNFLSMKHGFVGPIGARAALESLTFDRVQKFFTKAFSRPTKVVFVGESEIDVNLEFGESLSPAKLKYHHLDLSAQVIPSSVPMFVATEEITDEEHYHSPLINAMLGYGLKSPLYSELREKKGLCYWVKAGGQRIEDNIVNLISSSVSEDKIQTAGQAMLDVLENNRKFLTKERFDLIMQNRIISKKIADTDPASNAYTRHLISADKKWSFFKNIDQITYESTLAYFDRTMNPANIAWKIYSQPDVMSMK